MITVCSRFRTNASFCHVPMSPLLGSCFVLISDILSIVLSMYTGHLHRRFLAAKTLNPSTISFMHDTRGLKGFLDTYLYIPSFIIYMPFFISNFITYVARTVCISLFGAYFGGANFSRSCYILY